MSIGTTIARFMLKVFWPWFLINVWPIFQRHINKLIAKAFKGLAEAVARVFENYSSERTASAGERASDAEREAKAAASGAEREKHEAVARAWHEVAEQLRTENELLKQKIAEVFAAQQAATEQDVKSMQPSLETEGSRAIVVIDGTRTSLPALPRSIK